MLQLHTVIVSTRPGRAGLPVADWFVAQARRHGKFAIEVIDLAKVGLPLFDEPRHPRLQIVTALKMMPMFEAVALPFFAQLIDKETGVFAPPKVQDDAAVMMLDELLKWATALKTMRS